MMFSCQLQKEEIKSCEEHVKKLLEMTPPKGKDFLRKIEHILEREKNWVSMLFNLCLGVFLLKYSMEITMVAV
jgi:hypothetical protein